MANTPTTIYGFNKPASGDTPWATTANNDIDSIEQEIARQRLPFLSPTVGATTTCDLNQTTGARLFVFTVSQATTVAFSNVPTSSFGVRIRLLITNGSAFLVTWPAAITWLGGGQPVLRTAGVDEIELVTRDGGTTWYGSQRSTGPRVLYQNQALSTSSTSTVTLATITIPANTLIVNSQQLRLKAYGLQQVQAGAVLFSWAGTTIASDTPGAGNGWSLEAMVVRQGASSVATSGINLHAAVVGISRTSVAAALNAAVTVLLQGSVTAGGTLNVDGVNVELLAA